MPAGSADETRADGATPAGTGAAPAGRGQRATYGDRLGRGGWPVLLVVGMLTVFYGLLVMSLRPVAIATVAVLAAIAFVVAGVGQVLLGGGLDVPWRWFAYAGGVIAVLAGIAAFAWPGLTLVVLAVIAAWAFVVNGLVRLVSTLAQPKRDLWWPGLVIGAAELLLGLWAIGSPGREVLLLVNLIGIFLVVTGVDSIFGAFTARAARRP
jgi:uncharacterized membrane protein HdeD (DUF308 family)